MAKNFPPPPPELVEYYYRLRRPNESVIQNIKRAAINYSAAHPELAESPWWVSVLASHMSEVGHKSKRRGINKPLTLFE